jgi:hypothetical protein
MDEIDALTRKYPEHAGTIRQLRRRDEEFRALCDDYGESLRAFDHWTRVEGPSGERAEEYRQMTVELEQEAAAYVEASKSRASHR